MASKAGTDTRQNRHEKKNFLIPLLRGSASFNIQRKRNLGKSETLYRYELFNKTAKKKKNSTDSLVAAFVSSSHSMERKYVEGAVKVLQIQNRRVMR